MDKKKNKNQSIIGKKRKLMSFVEHEFDDAKVEFENKPFNKDSIINENKIKTSTISKPKPEKEMSRKERKMAVKMAPKGKARTFVVGRKKFKKPEQVLDYLYSNYRDVDNISKKILEDKKFYKWLNKQHDYENKLELWKKAVDSIDGNVNNNQD